MIIDNVLGDNIGQIELINSMGSDLDIVNDAKASFENSSTDLGEKEARLIKYLIRHAHWSPFRGVVFKFKVKAPLFIARQWVKHMVASSYIDGQQQWNEKSLRYVEVTNPDEFYIPHTFYQQSKSNKQGSSESLDDIHNTISYSVYSLACSQSFDSYKTLIENGVSREQARGVLVPAVYTSFVWTVSLQALMNFIMLRKGSGAQSEIQLYATACETLISNIVPITISTIKELSNEN